MSLRAVFHNEDDARAVAARLRRDGFDAVVEKDRFAGDDDDEDHAWAVRTDAPEYRLDLEADEHEGWLDHDVEPQGFPPVGRPTELPDAPRRVKGHWRPG
jgi:8-oxo-dGTP diphosphatase